MLSTIGPSNILILENDEAAKLFRIATDEGDDEDEEAEAEADDDDEDEDAAVTTVPKISTRDAPPPPETGGTDGLRGYIILFLIYFLTR